MNWSWETIVEPASEPITLDEAKDHLRVDHVDEDSLITALIIAARRYVEQICNRALMTQTIRAKFDSFPHYDQSIMLPQSPVQSIDSVKYIDNEGVLQTVSASDYVLDGTSQPARLDTAYNATWPPARYENNAVQIEYVAGSATVTEDIKHAIKLVVGSFYMNREAECFQQMHKPNLSIDALLAPYKLMYRGPWL